MSISVVRAKELYEDLDAVYERLDVLGQEAFATRVVRVLAAHVVDDEMHGAVRRWLRDHGYMK